MYFFQDSDYNIEDNETESTDQVDHLLRPRNSMNPADGVTEQNIVIALILEMEEENVLHSTEIVDLQLQEQQQGDLVYGDTDDGIDANENNQSDGGESNHENDGENIDVAIDGHNYSALHINHLLLLCDSWNPLDGAILCTSANDLTLEIEEENVSHYPENVAFQLEGQRLDDLVHENDGSDSDDDDDDDDDDSNDVDENNENGERGNDDENYNESIHFAIENQVPQAHVNLLS